MPLLSLKDLTVGADGDIGVDQRGAAEPRSHQHADVGTEIVIVKSERVQRTTRFLNPSIESVRKLAGQPFLSPFENADRRSSGSRPLGGRQSRRGHSRPVPRTDNNHVLAFSYAMSPI